jgi:hypothetical protein
MASRLSGPRETEGKIGGAGVFKNRKSIGKKWKISVIYPNNIIF